MCAKSRAAHGRQAALAQARADLERAPLAGRTQHETRRPAPQQQTNAAQRAPARVPPPCTGHSCKHGTFHARMERYVGMGGGEPKQMQREGRAVQQWTAAAAGSILSQEGQGACVPIITHSLTSLWPARERSSPFRAFVCVQTPATSPHRRAKRERCARSSSGTRT